MNHAFKRIAELSPQEKRSFLVRLLQKKASKPMGVPERFAANVTDLNAEAVLDPTICPGAGPVEPVTEPACIFLTGATGFLGAFLLSELLQHTQADIYCLVRAPHPDQGKKRLQKTLESYSLWHDDLCSRIIPVLGDLAEPLLGLSAEQFRMLAGKIDSIYHSGALVNWIYPYDRLKPTNVLGTQEVLRLASQTKVKPVHFISSLAVFPLVGDSDVKVVREQDTLDHGGVLYSGYPQSKWVADKLATITRSRGLPVCIYRPGMITGHSQTGAWNTNDVTCRMIKSWIELGGAPDLDMENGGMTPVDFVSKAIVHLSRQSESLGKVFHLINPRPLPLRELSTWIRSFGYPLRQVPYDRWVTELIGAAGRSREDVVHSLVPLFSLSISEEVPKMFKKIPVFDCQNTHAALASTSIVCPPIEGPVIDTYLSYLIRRGFVDPPPFARKPTS
jgi:thioester reductase-like protein